MCLIKEVNVKLKKNFMYEKINNYLDIILTVLIIFNNVLERVIESFFGVKNKSHVTSEKLQYFNVKNDQGKRNHQDKPILLYNELLRFFISADYFKWS